MNFLVEFFKGFIGTLNVRLLEKAEPFIIDEAKALVVTGERAVQILFNFNLSDDERKDAFEGWRNSFLLFAEACKREGSVLAEDLAPALLGSIADSVGKLFGLKK